MQLGRAKIFATGFSLRGLCIPFWIVILLLGSCANEKKREATASVAGALQKNKYANYFKLYRYEGFSLLITYLNPEKTDSLAYVIYSGQKPEIGQQVYYVQAPVKKVACLASVFTGFMKRLGEMYNIGAVDNIDFISEPKLYERYAFGMVKELARNGPTNIELALTSDVNVIFANPGGDKKRDMDKRLLKAGITPVICADYYENHPLGRAEWLRVFALFFGDEKRSDSLFNETEQKYLALKKSADTCSYNPTVFSELKTNDTWYVAGGESSLARLLADAGADYLWKDNGKTSVTALNMEQVMQKALHADYWINLHMTNSTGEVLALDKRYGEFKAFKQKQLFNNNALGNAKGGNAYWEDGLCNPDEILADLISIFHPALQPGHKLKYYKQLK
jgi:iron complex transport system substrate-binding protein